MPLTSTVYDALRNNKQNLIKNNMTKKQIFSKSLQANEELVSSLTKGQLEELMKVFDNYEIEQCAIHDVMLCTFCEKVIETELTYTEDAEPAHIKCLENFNKHWEDRTENMDLMGY